MQVNQLEVCSFCDFSKPSDEPHDDLVVAITGFSEKDVETFFLAIQLWVSLGFKVLARNMPDHGEGCLLYTSPSPRDQRGSRMPSSA